jgi:ceramide glucosyltransferase
MKARRAAALAAGVVAVAGIGYAVAALACVRAFARRPPDVTATGTGPAVTLLVPLFGDEPGLAENLRAFVDQDYSGGVQVVFGVHAANDAALPVATAVRDAFPAHEIAISVEAPPAVANPKVANLLAMLRFVRHDVLVLADSDMRVDAGYLRAVTAPLADARTGAVTTLYAGRSCGGVAADLGAAFVNEQFVPAALVASALGPLRHAYGATIALRRATLDALGGFAALGAHLADDHVLGARVAALGLRVVLARYVPRTLVAERTLGALWRHELRWHRTIRSVQPSGYAGLFLTYPVPLAFAAFALAPRARWTQALAVAAVVVRIAIARAASRAFGEAALPLRLVPLRDAFGLAVWACGLGGHRVEWRGAGLQLQGAGELARERPSP